MKQRKAIAIIVGLALCIGLGLVTCVLHRPSDSPMSLEEARVEVERNIRLGMTRLEVLEYLNRTEWVYTDYFTVDHQVWARVYGSIRGFVVDGDLHLDLTFDDDEKLTEYTLEEAFTGP